MVQPVRALRSALGTQIDPHTAWMLLRSLETLSLRMERGAENAVRVATFLRDHAQVRHVNYLGFLPPSDPRERVFKEQCLSAGSTFAFHVRGGEREAFKVLDSLQFIKLAVSLGGTETLISHPASTTHSGVPKTDPGPARHHRRHDPHLGRHRGCCGSDCRSGPGPGNAGDPRMNAMFRKRFGS